MRKRRGGILPRLGAAVLLCTLSCFPALEGRAGVWKVFTEGAWYYENDDGSILMNGYSPDGYYVDNTGLWYADREVMGYIIKTRSSFMKASESEGFANYVEPLTNLQAILSKNLSGTRQLVLYTNRITLYSVERTDGNTSVVSTSQNTSTNSTNNRPTAPSSQLDSQTGGPNASSGNYATEIDASKGNVTDVMTWYRNDEIDGYTLELKTALSDVTRLSLIRNLYAPQTYSWYDYQSLRMITNCTSATGDALADAIYQSWTGKNSYKLRYGQWVEVGDALVRFNPVTGIGRYDVKAAS